jgi:hypothetical protein
MKFFGEKELRAGWEERYQFTGINLDDILADDRFNIGNLKRENMFWAIFFRLPTKTVMYVMPSEEERTVQTKNSHTLWSEDGTKVFGNGYLMDIILGKEPYIVQENPVGSRKISIFDRNGNKVFGKEHMEDGWNPIFNLNQEGEGYDKFYFKSPNDNEYIILDEGVFRKDGRRVFGDIKGTYGPMTILEKDSKVYIGLRDKQLILGEDGNHTTIEDLGSYNIIKEIK